MFAILTSRIEMQEHRGSNTCVFSKKLNQEIINFIGVYMGILDKQC